MKMFPKIYESVTTEPFRVEEYNGRKVEFHYLDDNKNYAKFVSRGKFAVWTSNGVDYRLFIEKGYYEAVPDLYLNEVNDIWLDYTDHVYSTQKQMSRKYLFVSLGIFVVVMAIILILGQLFPEDNTGFLISMAVMFIGIFYMSSVQQKKLKKAIGEGNANATQRIQSFLGEERFEALIQSQNAYFEAYFKTDDAEETPVDDTAQIEQDQEGETEAEDKQ